MRGHAAWQQVRLVDALAIVWNDVVMVGDLGEAAARLRCVRGVELEVLSHCD
jgi:hypothetical protein